MDTFEDKVRPYFVKNGNPVAQSASAGSYPMLDPISVPLSAQQYYLAQQWIKREMQGEYPAVPK